MFVIELGFAVASIKDAMQKAIVALVKQVPGVQNVSVVISWTIVSMVDLSD